MPIKKDEILEMLATDVASCLFLLKKCEEENFEFFEFEQKKVKIYLFLHEFIYDYCEENNIEEFDF